MIPVFNSILIFKPFSLNKEYRFSKKILSIKARSIESGSLPKSLIRVYVRKTMSLEISTVLKEMGFPRTKFCSNDFPELFELWYLK